MAQNGLSVLEETFELPNGLQNWMTTEDGIGLASLESWASARLFQPHPGPVWIAQHPATAYEAELKTAG